MLHARDILKGNINGVINKIICGDNVEVMEKFPDEVVDLTVTSPPYDDIRSYHEYSMDIDGVIAQLFRITKNGGVVVWITSDQTIDGSESGSSFRQALKFMDIGFKLHDTMIYKKSSFANPSSNRCHQVFEYMFIFSKGRPKTFNPIKDRKNKTRKSGRAGIRLKDGSIKEGKRVIESTYGLRFNVWEYDIGYLHSSRDDIAYDHPAIFPEDLARDHIYMWSNEGDLVLDPFCGSGTTCKMAYLMKRKYIGIDISEKYCTIAERRVALYRGKQKDKRYWDKILNPQDYVHGKNSLRKYME